MRAVDLPTSQEKAMFWFQHPRPPSRKEVAEQVVMRKQAVPDVRRLIVERIPAQRIEAVLPPAAPEGND